MVSTWSTWPSASRARPPQGADPERAVRARRQRPDAVVRQALLGGEHLVHLAAREPRQTAIDVPTQSAPSAPAASALTLLSGRPCSVVSTRSTWPSSRAAPDRRLGADPERAVRARRQRPDAVVRQALLGGEHLVHLAAREPRQTAARCRPRARRPRPPPAP